jgi:hypothetical protein
MKDADRMGMPSEFTMVYDEDLGENVVKIGRSPVANVIVSAEEYETLLQDRAVVDYLATKYVKIRASDQPESFREFVLREIAEPDRYAA